MIRAIRVILGVTDAVALLAAAGLLFVVAGQIAARLAFDLSDGGVNLLLPGAIELSEHALLIMVFAALPRAALTGMIRVEVLIARLPRSVAMTLDRLWAFGLALFAAALALLLGAETATQAVRGDLTQDLALPLAAITGYAAAASAILAVVATLHAATGAGHDP